MNKKIFIPYITAGDPDLSTTEKLVYELEKRGAGLIELGVPFSDPIADGPTIQKASERALKNGVNLNKILNLVKKIRNNVNVPICLMTYYNPVFRYGIKKFARDASGSGVNGVIIPDLPPEESEDWIKSAREKNTFSTIFLLSPTSNYDRIKTVAKVSTGFIYYVSLTGVTGEREKLDFSIKESILKIRKITDIPVCVGFGISKREHIKTLDKLPIDGFIVGSAIVKVIENNIGKKDLVKKVGEFVSNLMGD